MTAEQLKALEERLWAAADKLRANSNLKASEYATPILGLIFLRFATIRFNRIKDEIKYVMIAQQGSRFQQTEAELSLERCGFYLPETARYDYLLNLPGEANIAEALKAAMEDIEKYKPELKDCLPKDEYFKLYTPENRTMLPDLLKKFADIPEDASGDVFGKVYEYFLSEFALSEGQGGGEFFTPTSVVKLMVEIIEPYKGTIFDPACGSGGMFVQSSYFVDRRKAELNDTDTKDLMVYGTDKTDDTVKLAKMNLAVNGLRGEIKVANTYDSDPYNSVGRFDFVMANPPFNVDDVSFDKVSGQARFNEYGIPQNKGKSTSKKNSEKDVNTIPNANYLWINLFATSLKPTGRAALVMANSASDARNSEAEIRQRLIESGVIDCMLTLPKNMFYTVTLPATLWFFDKRKQGNAVKVLFIDARNIFLQVSRSSREFTQEHIQNIAIIVRLYRGETHRLTELLDKYRQTQHEWLATVHDLTQALAELAQAFAPFEYTDAQGVTFAADKLATVELPDTFGKAEKQAHKKLVKEYLQLAETLTNAQKQADYFQAQINWLHERFPKGCYEDVIGLCKAATLAEIAEQDYSLNPGRYVGVVIEEDGLSEADFLREMKERHALLSALNEKAADLEKMIDTNFKAFL